MILLNPVFISVVLLCVLCLFKLNVLMSMMIALTAGGLLGGLTLGETLDSMMAGLGSNAGTALSYVLLGTLATAMAKTGTVGMMGRGITRIVGKKRAMLLLVLTGVACLSQNLVPVHIAFIPILIPPILILMNKLKIDRRAVACTLAFGLKAPYIALPFGFGLIFQTLVKDAMVENGMPVELSEISSVNWILAVAMFIGLLIAIFVTYRKPREYKEIAIEQATTSVERFGYKHVMTILAVIAVVLLQVFTENLAFAATGGLVIIFFSGAVKWKDIDAQFQGGVKLMGYIGAVMIIAGGFAQVMDDTGAVKQLVDASVALMGGNKLIAATMITVIGIFVTMGIGSSFSTIPILAILYVPLCMEMGFSPAATILLMSAAAALGDAGSPASDTTLGPTSGLNADGQHDHIWDTCVPTFIHFNIPLMIAAILVSQII